jgi:membrane fusion protein (multidrug efflux system)
LFTLGDSSSNAAVAEAEAQVAAARTDVGSMRADYQESLSQINAARAKLTYAQSEVSRQGSLLKEGISSRSQYDAAVLEMRTSRDAIVTAQAHSESLRASLGGNIGGAADLLPGVRKAASQLEKARIGLNDTVVRASVDGIVTKVHQLQPGNYVTPGRPVFMLAGTRFWVVANFKESQLRYMRVGQPATVKIDAFPDHELKAHVASFSPGTGNAFSILPAENATGNWVKVVQRLPVEIAIDEMPQGVPLHTGLSAEVTVDTGHKRHVLGASEDSPAAPQKTGANSAAKP